MVAVGGGGVDVLIEGGKLVIRSCCGPWVVVLLSDPVVWSAPVRFVERRLRG